MENTETVVADFSDGNIIGTAWEYRAGDDDELVYAFHEIVLIFGKYGPTIRLYPHEISSLQTVLSRLTDEIDKRKEQEDFEEVLPA